MAKFFIRRPIFAFSLAIIILLLGGVAFTQLSIEQYPNLTPPVVEVTALYPGADAESVNDAVATPIAQQVMGVSDMLYMQSTSADDGSMTLQVLFDVGSNPDMDAVLVENRVSQATALLPESVIQQGVTTQKTMTGFLMVYTLSSDGRYDEVFVSNYAYLHLQNELLKINGVGKVSIMGAAEYAMRVWLKPDVLKYYGVSVEEVAEAISAQSGIYPAGKFGAPPYDEESAEPTYTYTVRMPPSISLEEEFSNISLKVMEDGSRVRLGDVARLELGAKSYGTKSTSGGRPSSLIIIYQQPGSNAVEVGREVERVMARAEEKFYDGLEIEKIVDSTESIEAGVKDIFLTLVIALVLVVFIIYIFLQDFRATLIPLIAIPVSLIGVFIAFPLLGFSINVISLLGLVLAIGLVVDDAIVVVEAVQLNLAAGMEPAKAAEEAMKSVSSPIIATTVILLAVFVPVSFTGGISALLFQQFSITIALSVVISAFNALSLSPALCVKILKKPRRVESGIFYRFNSWFDRRMESYSKGVSSWLRHMARLAMLLAAIVAVIVVMWRSLPTGFLPEEDQGYVMVMVQTPEASSLAVTERVVERVEKLLLERESVKSSSCVAGYDMLASVASPNAGVIFLSLKPFDERKISAMELADVLNEELAYEVLDATCYAFVPPSIPGLGVSSALTLEVQDADGKGGGYLLEKSMDLISELGKSEEIGSVTTQYNGGVPQRRVEIDLQKAMLAGVNPSEIYSDLSSMLGGRYINNFSRFGKLYQTYIQADAEYRADASSLDSYFLTAASGELVPMSEFVKVRDSVGPAYISQFNLLRSIELSINPKRGYSSGDVIERVEEIASKQLPDDISVAWSGVAYQQSNSSGSDIWVYLLALLFVFLCLAALYNSWSLPLSVLLGVPLAVAGALLAMWIAHHFSSSLVNDVYLQISIVILIGMAAKNSILVVEYAERLSTERGLSLVDATQGAARLRVRPILMTAFAFILGVVPLVFAHGLYSTARHILGVSLVGGMLAATLLGIYLYPTLYYAVMRLFGAKSGDKS